MTPCGATATGDGLEVDPAKRVNYVAATDEDAVEGFKLLSRTEGILPALEPAHALAHVARIAPKMAKDKIIVMNLCGRGDKDIFALAERLGVKL